LEQFVGWLLGSQTQRQVGGRTFRRRHSWCWQVEPCIDVTGEVYDQIQLDGIYLSRGWCCLIASTPAGVIGWQWCDTEKKIAWEALLSRFPAPLVVINDGGSGLAAALKVCWPGVKVQRCLVHVQRNCRTHLTSNPRTDAGRALWGLAKKLTRIETLGQATNWLVLLNGWYQTYGKLIRQRTYRADTAVGNVPSWARPKQVWWYTHDRLRKAYRLLERLAREQVLFTYLLPAFEGMGIASTTNQIEGGVNAQLREVTRRHRGMPIGHRRRAFEWWMWRHAAAAPPLAELIRPEHFKEPPKPEPQDEDKPGDWGTAAIAEEGLWARKGRP
jgi:hypothetical protein